MGIIHDVKSDCWIEDRTKSIILGMERKPVAAFCSEGNFSNTIELDKKDFLEFKKLVNSVTDKMLEER